MVGLFDSGGADTRTRRHRRVLRSTAGLLLALLVLAGCSEDAASSDETGTSTTSATPTTATTTAEPAGYADFGDVDVYTHAYFISLEDVDTQSSADSLLWSIGVETCENFDAGAAVEDELERVGTQLGYGDQSGSIVASAALYICDQHEQMLRDWHEANG